MADQNRELSAHKTWLGLLEGHRVGIVVSPPALVAAQAYANADVIPAQNALLSLLIDKPSTPGPLAAPDPGAQARAIRELRDGIAERWGEAGDVVLPRLGPFCEAVLGWQPGDLAPVGPDDPLAAKWSVYLREQHDTLRPTHVLMDRDPADPPLLLVRIEPANTDLDALPPETDEGAGWRASPQVRFERLLRDTGVFAGVLFNGSNIRLVYAPRAETPGYINFPVRAMCEVGGRPILAGLIMLLHQDRLFTGPKVQRLPAILEDSRKYQSTVSTKLAGQVLDALDALVRGFQAANEADPRGRGELLREVMAEDRAQVYGGLLTTLMRLVFVLYAEDRALLPTDGVYPQSYSVTGLFERLREDAGRHPDTMHARYGAWAQLLTLFRVLHDGARASEMHIPARAGRLFDPDAYPFLEGRVHGSRRVMGERITPPLVSDGVIYEVLGLLLYLDGERLSYRALEVEQIGSVYEAMMGFTLEQARGRSIAVLPHHVVIDLDAALALGDAAREKVLAEAGCKLADAALQGWWAAKDEAGLLAALGKKVSPRTGDVLPVGALYLQPTEERRRSGSHYTPRTLTEPIVRTTLQAQLDRLGGGKTPTAAQILGLKVCDPAMGSGAFLVESCRFLADALDQAWSTHGEAPVIPPDEDRTLHARRLVAQRCLYGVDKNPFAVDLAKLSLWLFTLAKDHPFTFLDHALRQGDSLVGLSREQVACFDWKVAPAGKAIQMSLLRPLLANVMKVVEGKRAEIHALGDEPADNKQKARLLGEAEDLIGDARAIGDLAVLAFFSEKKDAAREKARKNLADKMVEPYLSGQADGHTLRDNADELRRLTPPVTPFHWELEFPEVFNRETPGFDGFVGNPPFLGGTKISTHFGQGYLALLIATTPDVTGNIDLAAYFVRRLAQLVRLAGTIGIITTNSVLSGDSYKYGIRRATSDNVYLLSKPVPRQWPGDAANVAFTELFFCRSAEPARSREDAPPTELRSRAGISCRGCDIMGDGFVLSQDEYNEWTQAHPESMPVVFPYLGGSEFNSSPTCAPSRFIINFGEKTREEAQQFRAAWERAERTVKPARSTVQQRDRRELWWLFSTRAPRVFAYLRNHDRCLVVSQLSKHLAFGFVGRGVVLAHTLIIFLLNEFRDFALLQSRAHIEWAQRWGSSMRLDTRYTSAACFETFPVPECWQQNPALEATGKEYYEYRAALMIKNNEGLTKIYNRFHDPDERSSDIHKLRELHAEMDRTVLDAYGWKDIPAACKFILDHDDGASEDEEAGKKRKKKPYRYRWPDDVRDEVLARLIGLNRVHAEGEKRRGVAVTLRAREADDHEEDADGHG